MNIKEKLTIAGIVGIGAGLGATVTALIMTKDCRKMIEKNMEDNKIINGRMDQINKQIEQVIESYGKYKENIDLINNESNKMGESIAKEFKVLAQQGKIHEENLKKISKVSIQIMKEELTKMVNKAQEDIEVIKQEVLDILENDEIIDDSDDITERMINQIDQDTGKTTVKKDRYRNKNKKNKKVKNKSNQKPINKVENK